MRIDAHKMIRDPVYRDDPRFNVLHEYVKTVQDPAFVFIEFARQHNINKGTAHMHKNDCIEAIDAGVMAGARIVAFASRLKMVQEFVATKKAQVKS